jgi:rhodanese-related sulfurtransferase
LPDLARLDRETVRSHLADGAVLVDARPTEAYSRAHPQGAISIRHRPAFASWLGWLFALDRPVVCGHAERAMTGASLLEAGGHRGLSVLVGGPADWRDATGIDLQTG